MCVSVASKQHWPGLRVGGGRTLKATQLFMQMFFYDLVYLLPLKVCSFFFSDPGHLDLIFRKEKKSYGSFQVFDLTAKVS